MINRNITKGIKPAGISTKDGEHIDLCFKPEPKYSGSETQNLYRNHKLGAPGEKTKTPGVYDTINSNAVFGIKTKEKNGSTGESMKSDLEHSSKSYQHYLEEQESTYQRSKQPVGHSIKTNFKVPTEIEKVGFGKLTKFSESSGTVIQNSDQDVLTNPRAQTAYQTKRNYNWKDINPNSFSFGVKSEGNIDHVHEVLKFDESSSIVPLAVDRAKNFAIVPDPDPVDPRPRTTMRKMGGKQVKNFQDPSELPPAGLPTTSLDFSVGDTICGLGLMDSKAMDDKNNKEWNPKFEQVHGIPTKPNPFPNPLKGNGRYSSLGLSEEDFMELRPKNQILTIMKNALQLNDEQIIQIFNIISNREKRNKISVSEFYDYYKNK